MTSTPPQSRKVLIGIGVAFCLLCMALWSVATNVICGYCWSRIGVAIQGGNICLLLGSAFPWDGFYRLQGYESTIMWLPNWGQATGSTWYYVAIPLWIPLLIVAFPTGFLIWWNRLMFVRWRWDVRIENRICRMVVATAAGIVIGVVFHAISEPLVFLFASAIGPPQAPPPWPWMVFAVVTVVSVCFSAVWIFWRITPGDHGCLIWRWMERMHRELRICIKCGYNLTGNVSGVCPECGNRMGKEG